MRRMSKVFEPGPRGKIVIALKAKPCSTKELAELTGLDTLQVRWYVKTLKDRCLLAEGRSANDARVRLYRLKTLSYEEPPKPILTPSIVALTDDGNWETWYERLIIEENGGPAISIDESDLIPTEKTYYISPAHRKVLPKVLIIGSMIRHQMARLEQEFGGKLKLYFVDRKAGNTSFARCRGKDHIFVRYEFCSHSDFDLVRSLGTPFSFVKGGHLTKLSEALAQYCEAL